VRILVGLAAIAITMLSGDSDRATALITVGGSAHGGDFLVRNADVPCTVSEQMPPRPKHLFSVSVGAETQKSDPKKLTVLILIIPNADVRGTNHAFFASIIFGDVAQGTQYFADTRPGGKSSGSGTVIVSPHGSDATVTFDATTADSVSFKGTLQCSGVSHD
jgi:hypothetical protein